MQSGKRAMVLPPPSHIGIVVKDIDKTTKLLSSMLGLGPWDIVPYSPSTDEIMVGETFTIRCAFAKLGPVVLELLQPVEGKSIWSRVLETMGEGVHHIAFDVPNWDEMVSKMQDNGGRMLAGGIYYGRRWCYFDTKIGGIIIEFEEEPEKNKAE